uniref:RING-type E3 ubiquitin transferase n=1 Tax=Elaeophora elaphi TaxID=1147741 RepID=A0A0R3S3L3_9BILA
MSTSERRREHYNKSRSDNVSEEESRYECSICYKEAVNPVVLSCGHFYCWECIDEWMNKYAYVKKQCPICKRRVRDGDVCFHAFLKM